MALVSCSIESRSLAVPTFIQGIRSNPAAAVAKRNGIMFRISVLRPGMTRVYTESASFDPLGSITGRFDFLRRCWNTLILPGVFSPALARRFPPSSRKPPHHYSDEPIQVESDF